MTFHGKYYDIDSAPVVTKPVQQPLIPWYATRTPEKARWCARLGMPMMALVPSPAGPDADRRLQGRSGRRSAAPRRTCRRSASPGRSWWPTRTRRPRRSPAAPSPRSPTTSAYLWKKFDVAMPPGVASGTLRDRPLGPPLRRRPGRGARLGRRARRDGGHQLLLAGVRVRRHDVRRDPALGGAVRDGGHARVHVTVSAVRAAGGGAAGGSGAAGRERLLLLSLTMRCDAAVTDRQAQPPARLRRLQGMRMRLLALAAAFRVVVAGCGTPALQAAGGQAATSGPSSAGPAATSSAAPRRRRRPPARRRRARPRPAPAGTAPAGTPARPRRRPRTAAGHRRPAVRLRVAGVGGQPGHDPGDRGRRGALDDAAVRQAQPDLGGLRQRPGRLGRRHHVRCSPRPTAGRTGRRCPSRAR